ncbi:MAG: ribose-phosphate pyrophosphokinase [Candidatus Levybacteria bacterium]|nr:ribose-phosphate pyrophosphokinase [Candidatus Levybacteria bacterium]
MGENILNSNDFVLLTGTANLSLSQKIALILKKDLNESVSVFSDGEIRIRIPINLRRRIVYIIQPTPAKVNDNIMELILLIDAAKRASAKEVVAIIPYFGYSRQDRKEMPRVPISASVIASMVEHAGADRIVTIDIHSEQQEGFVQKPWDNLYSSYSLLPEIKKRKLSNLIVASPDKGGVTRATGYAKLLGAEGIAIVYKERDITLNNKSEAMAMVGNVQNKDVLLVDDMLDTGGTIVNAASYIKQKGARSVRVAVTHGLFSGQAINKINKSIIDEVIVTDTVSLKDEIMNSPKITVVSVAPLLAEAIKRIQTGESISEDLIL